MQKPYKVLTQAFDAINAGYSVPKRIADWADRL